MRDERDPALLSWAEIQAAIGSAARTSPRDHALVALTVATGLPTRTLVRLAVDDVCGPYGIRTVLAVPQGIETRRHAAQRIDIPQGLRAVLRRYLAWLATPGRPRATAPRASRHLFRNETRDYLRRNTDRLGRLQDRPISAERAARILTAHVKAARPSARPAGPRTLRRSVARLVYDWRGLAAARDYLGLSVGQTIDAIGLMAEPDPRLPDPRPGLLSAWEAQPEPQAPARPLGAVEMHAWAARLREAARNGPKTALGAPVKR